MEWGVDGCWGGEFGDGWLLGWAESLSEGGELWGEEGGEGLELVWGERFPDLEREGVEVEE